MPAKSEYRVVQLRHHDPALLTSLQTLHQALRTHHGADPHAQQFIEFITQRLDDEGMLLILALADSTPVGYGLAFDVPEHPFMPDWKRAGYITQLFVAPQHRRRGVGQRLLHFIVEWLASRGVTNVLLNVSVNNPGGEQFWRKQGFIPLQVRMRRKIAL